MRSKLAETRATSVVIVSFFLFLLNVQHIVENLWTDFTVYLLD